MFGGFGGLGIRRCEGRVRVKALVSLSLRLKDLLEPVTRVKKKKKKKKRRVWWVPGLILRQS